MDPPIVVVPLPSRLFLNTDGLSSLAVVRSFFGWTIVGPIVFSSRSL